MKKESKLICSFIVLLMLSSIFSGCVSRGTSTITTQQSTPTGNEQTSSTNTPDTTSQTGSPYILSGISYDTETIDKNNHIQLSVQNYGKGKATNVAIVISNDYYSNFSLQSVNPNLRVDGNRFYIGDIAAGEKIQVDIYLKAKQSGLYTGTISYTYDGLEESGKIKDLRTLVP